MKDIKNQAKNIVTISGKLMEMSTRAGKTSDGRPYESVRYTVQVTQEYGGQTETSNIELNAFATQYTADNKVSSSYESIQRLKAQNTVQNVGFDEAAVISVTRGSLQENNFVTKSGNLVSNWEVSSNFFSNAKKPEIASFNCDIHILDILEEVDRNEEPTGRLIIKGGLVQYGEKVDIVDFIVEHPDNVEHVSRNWSVGDTVNVGGRIRFTTVEEFRNKAESSWGEELPDTFTRTVRELIVTRGSDEPFDEEEAFDPVEIKKGLNARKAKIEQLQNSKPKATEVAAPKKKSVYDWDK